MGQPCACGEEYVDGLASRCPAGYDLGIVGIKVGMEELDVFLDGGAVGR
jgi:hypothetical protein